MIGLLVNPKNPASESETSDTQAAARALGLKLIVQNASSSYDIDAAFASFVQQRVDALTFAADAVLNNCRDQLVALAARHTVPTIYFAREFTRVPLCLCAGVLDVEEGPGHAIGEGSS